jgi:hypothetical protein
MESLLSLRPDLQLTIITGIPESFFLDALPGRKFTFLPVTCDVGLVQRSPFEADLPETLRRLEQLYPVTDAWRKELSNRLPDKPDLVVADTSPAGLDFAAAQQIPSVLIENMTWAWLYDIYKGRFPEIEPFITYFAGLDRTAAQRLQTIPFCEITENGIPIPPVARRPRTDAESIRKMLGLRASERMILMTFGGVDIQENSLPTVPVLENTVWIICGGVSQERRIGNMVQLPHHSRFYMPDLVQAADLVIGKLGYSTTAEAAVLGKPFLYFTREDFRETNCLMRWTEHHLCSKPAGTSAVSTSELAEWVEWLLSKDLPTPMSNGAPVAAAELSTFLNTL